MDLPDLANGFPENKVAVATGKPFSPLPKRLGVPRGEGEILSRPLKGGNFELNPA